MNKRVTKIKVAREAKKPGYQIDRMQTPAFGVVVTRINDPFYGDFLQHLTATASLMDYSLIFRHTDGNVMEELTAIHDLDQVGVKGLLLLNPVSPPSQIQPLIQTSRPIVAVNAPWNPQPGLGCISVDQEKGTRQAMEHLFELGHRNIAYLSGPLYSRTNKIKRAVYEAMLRERGAFHREYIVQSVDHVVTSLNEGYQAGRQLLEAVHTFPTAILAYNDLVAAGAMRAIYERGLQIPQDISVIGFDDLEIARYTIPSLTTVATPRAAMADEAITLLRSLLENQENPDSPEHITFPAVLKQRESTGTSSSVVVWDHSMVTFPGTGLT